MSTKPTLVSFKGTTALRAPDGALMQLSPNFSSDTISKELEQRAQKRRASPLDLSTRGYAPQIFTPVIKALEQATKSRRTNESESSDQDAQLVLYAMQNLDDEKEADALLSQGKAVLRVHREDDVLWVHPLADPLDIQAIRAHDVRARRLAASPAPEVMQQIIQQEGFDILDDLPESAVLLATAEILKSVCQWMHKTTHEKYSPGHPHRIFRLEMNALRVSFHPILRVPQAEPLTTS